MLFLYHCTSPTGLVLPLKEICALARERDVLTVVDGAHAPGAIAVDIPAIDAIFLSELDDRSNPLKSKGIGELGICGAGASIANAIYNACGARIRDYPITLDKLLSALPVQA